MKKRPKAKKRAASKKPVKRARRRARNMRAAPRARKHLLLPRRPPAPLPLDRFDPKIFAKRRACVLGLGRSGLQIANLLAKKGFKVFISDSRPRAEVRELAKKLHSSVKWEGGGHSGRVFECHFAVKSPGIPSHAQIILDLRNKNIPIFSELETALAFSKSKQVIGITGTNGKSTTTAMVAAIMKAARKKVHMAGNIGIPVASVVSKVGKNDVIVLEVSSYQLEDSRSFHPRACAITNITADHVDHHGSMARYIAAKSRIFKDQHRGDVAVFNGDDPITVKLSRQSHGRRLYFSHRPSTLTHAWIDGSKLVFKLPGKKKAKEIKLIPPKLPGLHNLENAMAAGLVALDCGIPAPAVQKAFKAFKGVEHRIEDCGSVRGIRCINDSKATNVESTITALRALPGESKNILLILGGLHKGYPYTPLKSHIERNVKGILTIGSAANKIEEDLSGLVPIFPCKTLDEAVRTGLHIGSKGDTLLLSPACASFDQFKDFEHRGRSFKTIVQAAAKQ